MNLKLVAPSSPVPEPPSLTNLDVTPPSQSVPREDLSPYLTRKRKWTDEIMSGHISDSEAEEALTSSREHSTVSVETNEWIQLKKPTTSSENVQLPKRLKAMGRTEMNVLRIQIAMISDDDGDRPIHVAVAQENMKLVQKLCGLMLKAAISLDLTNYLRQTPLHLAVILGNADMINLLLKYGASVKLKDRNGNSVIHLAVKTHSKEDVLELILSHPETKSLLNSLDHEGYSALHYAVLKNNETAVRCLHGFGAWMDVVDGKSGRTPIIHAILENNAKMVKLLLECDASVETVDYSGRTAFELALQSSNKQVIKMLEKFLFCEAPVEEISPEECNHTTPSNGTSNRTRNQRMTSVIKTRSACKKKVSLDKT